MTSSQAKILLIFLLGGASKTILWTTGSFRRPLLELTSTRMRTGSNKHTKEVVEMAMCHSSKWQKCSIPQGGSRFATLTVLLVSCSSSIWATGRRRRATITPPCSCLAWFFAKTLTCLRLNPPNSGNSFKSTHKRRNQSVSMIHFGYPSAINCSK